MQNLNWIDYIIIAIFALSILSGLFRGLFREIVSLCVLVIAFVVATLFASPVATLFTNSQSVQHVVGQASSSAGLDAATSVSYVAIGLSFGLLFIATVIVGAIVGMIVNWIFQSTVLGIGNRLLGGIFGFFRGFLINLVLIFLVQLTSFSTDETWTQSQLVTAFQPAVQWLGTNVSPDLANLKEKLNGTLKNTTITTPATTTTTTQ
jgi:membrane protein required for colicin V production